MILRAGFKLVKIKKKEHDETISFNCNSFKKKHEFVNLSILRFYCKSNDYLISMFLTFHFFFEFLGRIFYSFMLFWF